MSSISVNKSKVEALKNVLKLIHQGEDIESIKKKFRNLLSQVSPFEIPIIEQELIRDGISVNDILKLCDLHVELFREYLQERSLTGVPEGHPLDLLLRENEEIMKISEALSLYANALKNSSKEGAIDYIRQLRTLLVEAKKIRLHYRKVQMLIFPYLERRGIYAVPRVLWGREDRIIMNLRKLLEKIHRSDEEIVKDKDTIADEILNLSKEIAELVFRENKILYPSIWALFTEGEWAAIKEEADKMGYIVDKKKDWIPNEKPIWPYELASTTISEEQYKKMPPEIRSVIDKGVKPDNYVIKNEEDIDLGTGFLSVEEIKSIFNNLPLDITYANKDDRVKFYTNSRLLRGFVRTKTIIGRKMEYCHPPRLEYLVKKVANDLKEGKRDIAVFWTRLGGRIIRVMIAPVRNEKGEYLGTMEIVEDFTEIIENPEEIKKKILVL